MIPSSIEKLVEIRQKSIEPAIKPKIPANRAAEPLIGGPMGIVSNQAEYIEANDKTIVSKLRRIKSVILISFKSLSS